jgi:hypothetical protein
MDSLLGDKEVVYHEVAMESLLGDKEVWPFRVE